MEAKNMNVKMNDLNKQKKKSIRAKDAKSLYVMDVHTVMIRV